MFVHTSSVCSACGDNRAAAELVGLDAHGEPIPPAAEDLVDATTLLCRACLAIGRDAPVDRAAVLDTAHEVDRHFTFEPRLVERTRLTHGFATAGQARAFLVGYWTGRLTADG